MQLLDDIVKAKKWIDAIFISELGTGMLLEGSKTLDGRDPKLIEALMGAQGSGGLAFANTGIFHALQRMMDAFGHETGHGKLSSTILQFGDIKNFKGILVVYVYHLQQMSLAIGFVSTRQEGDTLAGMVIHCESNIKNVLKEVENKYGP